LTWTPPVRPRVIERLIAHGEAVGGAEHLIPLDGQALIDEARHTTGLDAFGDDGWRSHYDVLLRALDEESDLHVVGRLLVRTELLRSLVNRLRLTALWRDRPELLTAPIEQPVFIVGSPRSGTSILHELMATDPASRAPAMWEMNHPVEAFEGTDPSGVADQVIQFWHDLQPEYETMHANSGHLPNECIFITMHAFLSDHWGGNHVVPSYERHLARSDQTPAYRFHADFLRTLQSRRDSTNGPMNSARWLLKAPSHLSQLAALFSVYPDARILRTHRDPLRTLPSAINLLGTLKWMRCRDVDLTKTIPALASGYAYLYRREIEQRASGELPDERFIDVQFADLVRDPVATVADIYRRLGWPCPDDVRRRIADYARRKPRGSRGVHRYSLASVGLDADEERNRYDFYLKHFSVPLEGDTGAS
jgi:hypothetical protein